MSVFLDSLSMFNMLSYAEQVQIQKYKTHAYKALKTVGVQIIMLKHPTKHKKEYPENPYTVSTYTKLTPTIQTNDDRQTDKQTDTHTHTHTHTHTFKHTHTHIHTHTHSHTHTHIHTHTHTHTHTESFPSLSAPCMPSHSV